MTGQKDLNKSGTTLSVWILRGSVLVGVLLLAGLFLRSQGGVTEELSDPSAESPRLKAGQESKQLKGAGAKDSPAAKQLSSKQSGKTNVASRVRGGVPPKLEGSSEEVVRARKMRSLLDEGNEREAMSLARELMHAPDVDVRRAVVTVLGWMGARAMGDLMAMIGDGDGSVAEDALTQFELALNEIENEQTKADMLEQSLALVKSAEDAQRVMMQFTSLDQAVAIPKLIAIIGRGSTQGEVAREIFEHITGNPFTTPENAQLYLTNRMREGQL